MFLTGPLQREKRQKEKEQEEEGQNQKKKQKKRKRRHYLRSSEGVIRHMGTGAIGLVQGVLVAAGKAAGS